VRSSAYHLGRAIDVRKKWKVGRPNEVGTKCGNLRRQRRLLSRLLEQRTRRQVLVGSMIAGKRKGTLADNRNSWGWRNEEEYEMV
jgi:hypothetical protein